MTATVQLTDAQLAQFTACGLIVVDGEPGGIPRLQISWTHAPELWRSLTEPCAACKGRGEIPRGGPIPYRWVRPCPDCDRGRQVVTLTTTCKACRGMGAARYKNCQTCNASGTVKVGSFTIRLLPVHDEHAETFMDHSVEVTDQGLVLLHSADGVQRTIARVALDPLPQPGQWAVQFEAVDSIAPK